ncbi:hypothetical protein SAMN05421678_107254 [Actinopolymorpha cephalotaxi]|uniref:Uncharacterized protein n=1 Tax=Actinopolymorpha cephalotaxi TaxID=504797 RepID=A0A1I2TUV0_9ACTN|nr:hypothetical protein [Actinopolymorpha cephalotaxi]NYH83147.1 hypothetical protein [Actinopolymorpha cephalotaxi]SFG66071.1 hypothetical protein SAMN05421678_107254 [Actinopolymorpha cephalotaxi]
MTSLPPLVREPATADEPSEPGAPDTAASADSARPEPPHEPGMGPAALAIRVPPSPLDPGRHRMPHSAVRPPAVALVSGLLYLLTAGRLARFRARGARVLVSADGGGAS